MKRSLFALAIGAFALLPLGLSQPASADYYDGYGRHGYYGRLERDIDRDRAALHRDYADRRYYGERERQALHNGDYLRAWWFGLRRRHEEREIRAERADIDRDYRRLERYPY